ncbi:sorbosone dehydrogenase family protein [Sphingomonas sp. KRR8]|uniref:PQQ-dependent sugar dehydrogenase n=1 Tax=Sphingomonas sp. KRR8 TaxID=2942996 RepID=UPI002021A607|nr:sorbosone dehydrogenase family protein [Sphingomonas sp. KRR8]URD62133.1 sorbosone dehydrogenase family protein [Sphingomonas sp. KRR8]
MNARTLLPILLAGTLAACGSAEAVNPDEQLGPNPKLPAAQQYLMPPMKVGSVLGWKDGEHPTAPPGFTVQAFATRLKNPRFLYPLPNGDVIAVESMDPGLEGKQRPKDFLISYFLGKAHGDVPGEGPSNRLVLLRDANGDGVAEGKSVLIDHVFSPFGVTYSDGALYVAATDGVLKYPFTPGQTHIDAKPTMLTELPGGPIDHHWTKSLTISPDGSKLYATVGSNSNIVENGFEAEKGRAAVWEIDKQSGRARVFATGLRNPNSPTFYPGTNTFWVVVNERDELGQNLVPDYMTSVKDGGFYGWPYSYYGQHVDPRVRPQRPDMVAKAISPDYALSSHVAALGLTFYTGASFPAQYRGGAFVGEHGSWDRDRFNGYKVAFVPFSGGKPSGKAQDFLTGFIAGDGDNVHGRPVGVAVDRTGALLVADDAGNTIWRVAPAGAPAARPQQVAAR